MAISGVVRRPADWNCASTARVRVCVITNQQTIANNTCTRVYVLEGAWSVIHGLTINAVINEDCRVDAAVMGS